MKKWICVVLFLVCCGNIVNNEEVSSDETLFYLYNNTNVTAVEVLEYDSLYSSNFSIFKTISNQDTISLLLNLLKELPSEGEIMISFEGGVSFHRVVLVDPDSGNDTIDIIAERLKTPSTSFYKPMRDAEEEFVRVVLQN